MKSISTILSIFTSIFGVATITSILGIIILVLSIANILLNAGTSIYEKIKNRQYKDIQEDIQRAKEELERLKEEHKEE